MSNSTHHRTTGAGRNGTTAPRAVVHKQILDAASAKPTASIEELADEVSAASISLVERVLEEYGDPADEDDAAPDDATTDGAEAEAATGSSETDATADGGAPVSSESPEGDTEASADSDTGSAAPDESPDELETSDSDGPDLDERDRALLAAIAEHPHATQERLGDVLGVSRATISRRVSDIDGLEWRNRASFVDEYVDETESFDSELVESADAADAEGTATSTTVAMSTSDADVRVNGATESESESEMNQTKAEEATDDGGTTDEHEPAGASETAVADGALADRLTTIESRLDELASAVQAEESDGAAGGAVFDDPELVHKVVHACLESERITEDEELRILASVLDGDRPA